MMRPDSSILKGLIADPLAALGLLAIVLAAIISILGANIRPDDSLHANEQHIAIARKAPGFSADFLCLPRAQDRIGGTGFFFGAKDSQTSCRLCDSIALGNDELLVYWESELREKIPTTQLPQSPDKDIGVMQLLTTNYKVKRTYYLGTDSFGRDMLSRLMAGTIVSLSVGLISVLISLLIGLTLGALAGYAGGWIDSLIMWFINVMWSIPTLLMVIAITLVMGKGFVQVFVAVGLTMWVEVARIVRGQFLSLRSQPYIEAGQSMGFSSLRLIGRHILPNAIGPVIVISAANFAAAILIEAGLSFLGIGTQIPMPSWGGMIKEHYAYITTDMAYLAVLPGLCIGLLVLSLVLIGNRLRDLLDVRS